MANMSQGAPKNWWRPTATLEMLEKRACLLRDFRGFFDALDFIEVQTPILSRDTVVDRHIEPIVVEERSISLDVEIKGEEEAGPVSENEGGSTQRLSAPSNNQSSPWYLQTSPEFSMKRLLAAGAQRIYQICPAFRAGEIGPMHNPEFTMLEWYRVGDDLDAGVSLLRDLVARVANVDEVATCTFAQAFEVLGIDPLSASVADMTECARRHSVSVGEDWSQEIDDWIDLLFTQLIQPKLGIEKPVIVTNYPASQSALAQLSEEQPGTAERFELFINGVELANGYHELLDPDEFASRNSQVQQQRNVDGKRSLPKHSRLLDAMRSGLPGCAGCALGIERMLMVLTDTSSIDQVTSFPIQIA